MSITGATGCLVLHRSEPVLPLPVTVIEGDREYRRRADIAWQRADPAAVDISLGASLDAVITVTGIAYSVVVSVCLVGIDDRRAVVTDIADTIPDDDGQAGGR